MKVRELREQNLKTAKWFLPTDDLLDWVNSELLSKAVEERGNPFSLRSLQMWLNECWFHYEEVGKKGVYFDGHERDDVKRHRTEYIERQKRKHLQYVRFDDEKLDDPNYWLSNPKPYWNPPCGASGLENRPILKVSHDESIFRLFGYVSRQWLEQERPGIFQKVKDEAFMLVILLLRLNQ